MSKFFINRPIVAIVISVLIVLGGLVAMSGLPVAQFPDLVPPLICCSMGVATACSSVWASAPT